MSSSTAPISNNGVSDIFTITNPRDGSKATVHSQGGHVVSWVGTDGDERLYMSPAHKFAQNKAIRGGVPVIFPQFSDMGSGTTHGAVRNRQWACVGINNDDGVGVFEIRIAADDKDFPNAQCRLTLTVTVSDKALKLTAKVDETTFESSASAAAAAAVSDFGFAFHTYFAVSDISSVTLAGFEDGMPFADNLQNRKMVEAGEQKAITVIDQEVDRIYVGVKDKAPLTIKDPKLGRDLLVSGENLPDVVLWNPWVEKNARLGDLPQPDGYKQFLCIEHGVLMPRVAFPLKGKEWVGSQIIQCVKN